MSAPQPADGARGVGRSNAGLVLIGYALALVVAVALAAAFVVTGVLA